MPFSLIYNNSIIPSSIRPYTARLTGPSLKMQFLEKSIFGKIKCAKPSIWGHFLQGFIISTINNQTSGPWFEHVLDIFGYTESSLALLSPSML